MTENTQTVTVADAWAERLWETGALWRGPSTVTSITVNTLGFSIFTPTGAFIDYADDLLDYTPLLTGDEDTEPIVVIVETGAQS